MHEIFKYENNNVRTVLRDGDPWFVANDVARILGYVDQKQAVRDHCKCPELLKGVESTPFTSSPRGITIIPERDVYRLIMRSNLPTAEKFENWVVSDVLPAIRKTGRYEIKQKDDLIILAEAFQISYKVIKEQEQKLIEQAPKVEGYNTFIATYDAVTIKDFANTTFLKLGLGTNNMFKVLRALKLIDTKNRPYQTAIAKGWFLIKETIFQLPSGVNKIGIQPLITPIGQEHILKVLQGI